jgi:hypothetical protein
MKPVAQTAQTLLCSTDTLVYVPRAGLAPNAHRQKCLCYSDSSGLCCIRLEAHRQKCLCLSVLHEVSVLHVEIFEAGEGAEFAVATADVLAADGSKAVE